MIRFLAIQHTYSEFLGLFEEQLEARGLGFVYQRPVTGQDIAGSALQFDALWLLGGAYPVTDREHAPWLDDELRLVQIFRRARRPVIGLGFGGQLVMHAFGGAAQAQPAFDARWTTAHRTPGAGDDPLAAALDGHPVLVLVNGSVSLAPGVAPLLVDDDGHWLAARPAEGAYALLFRPELKPGMIEDMIMEDDRPLPEHIGELLEETRERWEVQQECSQRTLRALVTGLDLMAERRKMPVFTLHPAPPRP